MSEQAYIFELTAHSFGSAAVLNSHKLPVLVVFLDVSSGPCFAMADRLARLATEFAGQFIFGKVDVAEQQDLRKQYQIENVPTLIVLKDGDIARSEVGELQDDELRALLKDFGIVRQSDELRLQAREKHLAGDSPGAILLLTQAIQEDPANVRVAMDMVQVMLDIGQPGQARDLFARLPSVARDSDTGKAISRQLLFLDLAAKTDGLDTLQARVDADAQDLQAHFDLAMCRVAIHQYDQAMAHLFQIVTLDADFQNGAAREMISVVANMIMPSEPDKANGYRRRLGNIVAG